MSEPTGTERLAAIIFDARKRALGCDDSAPGLADIRESQRELCGRASAGEGVA
jgi:hypothetical protein